MNALVPVGGHDIEIAHGREEVQIAVASVASARVIKSIQGPVTEKVLAILFNHCLPYLFVQLWSVFAEKLLENGGGKKPVALFIQVRSVHGQVAAGRGHRGFGRGK